MSIVYKGSSTIVWDAPAGNIDSYNVRVLRPGEDVEVIGPQSQLSISAVDPDEPVTECTAADLFDTVAAGDYVVYVRAQDTFGDWGPYSAGLPVTLVLGPEAPENVSVI
jgi:hypothetical protein